MEIPMTKEQYDNKLRCARFLLDMIEKYGAEILEEAREEEAKKAEEE